MWNKKYNKLLIIGMFLMPMIVFAKGNTKLSLTSAIEIESFMTLIFLMVYAGSKDKIPKETKPKFWIIFLVRIAVLLYFDFYVTKYNIAVVDFLASLASIILFVIITIMYDNKPKSSTAVINNTTIATPQSTNQVKGIEIRCAKCNNILEITDKFCTKCGAPFDGDNVVVKENADSSVDLPKKEYVLPTNFDKIYNYKESLMLEFFIDKELAKAGIDKNTKLIPSDLLKRKKVFNLIFSILLFVYISLIFFHFPLYTYIIGIILLFIFFVLTRRFNFNKYLVKQIKARPSEKISNIIMSVKNTLVDDNSKKSFIISFLISVSLPLVIFLNPRIIYEKIDNGYAVRYYIFGLSNFTTATIPKMYKSEKVVSLRGNTFSNMPLLKSVTLPDTITEIRGQAFMNCYSLKEVNIPKNIEYLGGGAFKNAISIKRVILPDTLTYLGGESFYGAVSLEYVILSKNLEEIRGDTFEYCTSLKRIVIPDKVKRIGGHAFYGDSSLEDVFISQNSQLIEIGSSAFRECPSLKNIIIPNKTNVNSRAFKDSPTKVIYYDYNYDFNNDLLY